jgi:hypothetical protein
MRCGIVVNVVESQDIDVNDVTPVPTALRITVLPVVRQRLQLERLPPSALASNVMFVILRTSISG